MEDSLAKVWSSFIGRVLYMLSGFVWPGVEVEADKLQAQDQRGLQNKILSQKK